MFQLKERLSLLKTAEREKEESKRDEILAAKEVNHIIVFSLVVEQMVRGRYRDVGRGWWC